MMNRYKETVRALDALEYENLAQLQKLTDEGTVIVDPLGNQWTKNERNWWGSEQGEEVLGSHFFDYGISVYHISASQYIDPW